MRAIDIPEDERRRRMKALRKLVAAHDVYWWANGYLEALASAPERPHRPSRAGNEERRVAERANTFNRRASDRASELEGSRENRVLTDEGRPPG
jgi:hypothetical protein